MLIYIFLSKVSRKNNDELKNNEPLSKLDRAGANKKELQNTTPDDKKISYFCTICDTSFKIKKRLTAHVKRFHPEFFDKTQHGEKRKRKDDPEDVYTKRLKKDSKMSVTYRNYFG